MTMRRLFVAALVLLAGPAQAVDYVKCEAMQKAFGRVTASAEQAEKDAWREIMKRYEETNCGVKPSTMSVDYTTKKVLAWYDCASAARTSNSKQMQAELASDPNTMSLRARAAKIQADYNKLGCY